MDLLPSGANHIDGFAHGGAGPNAPDELPSPSASSVDKAKDKQEHQGADRG
jgi:hypothetical protein